LLRTDGVLFVSIDKTERTALEYVLTSIFKPQNKVEELIWVQNTNDGRAPTYSTNHEYVEVYAKNLPQVESMLKMFREPKPGYAEVSALIARLNPSYPLVSGIQQALIELYRVHENEYRASIEALGLEWDVEKRNDPWNGIYQYKFAEYRDEKGRYVEEALAK